MAPLLGDLPLFPLGTVLFPGGLLPLKIFEARYLDMVRAALREKTSFGVCLLRSGSEVAAPISRMNLTGQPAQAAQPETVGCLADIIDCDVQQLGVMLIRCRGTQRFRVLSTHVEKDGLLRGVAELIEPDPALDPAADNHTLRVSLASCAEVLERIVQTVQDRDAANNPFLEPYRFDDASWVSNRLAEVLPISMKARQQLMALEDAAARLDLVHQYMGRHQML